MEGIVTFLKSGKFGASGSQLRRQIRSPVGQLEMKGWTGEKLGLTHIPWLLASLSFFGTSREVA